MNSPAFQYLSAAWAAFNDGTLSALRLGHAMLHATRQAIATDRRFDPGDFAALEKAAFGKISCSMGIDYHDNLYSLACERANAGHPSAAISIEQWLDFSPFLWAEKTSKKERLHIGERLTWKGETVTVTSFRAKRTAIVAVTYKKRDDRNDGDSRDVSKNVGKASYVFGSYRTVQYAKETPDGCAHVRYGPKEGYSRQKVARKFIITLAELDAERKRFEKLTRDGCAALRGCATLEDIEGVRAGLAARGPAAYRHFDLEALHSAYSDRHKTISKSLSKAQREAETRRLAVIEDEALESWVEGGTATRFFAKIRLRVSGGSVEVSNGNAVPLEDARKLLPWLLARRRKASVNDGTAPPAGMFTFNWCGPEGVTIGCTLIPWVEVERLDEMLKTNP